MLTFRGEILTYERQTDGHVDVFSFAESPLGQKTLFETIFSKLHFWKDRWVTPPNPIHNVSPCLVLEMREDFRYIETDFPYRVGQWCLHRLSDYVLPVRCS